VAFEISWDRRTGSRIGVTRTGTVSLTTIGVAFIMTELHRQVREPQDNRVSASVQRHVTELRDREGKEERINPSMPAWKASSASEKASQGKMSSRPRLSSKQAVLSA
jgi:hypothetical protein